MSDWQEAGTFRWRELAPFGVELDADFSAPLPPADSECFIALFRRHGLLVARGQKLSMQQQRALLSLLGPVLLREGESGYLSNEGEHEVVKYALAFHADAAYTEHPFDAIALHAVDVLDNASFTRFASAERACELLPPALLRRLAAHEAELITPGFELLAERVCRIPDPEAMQRAFRPTVLVNPHSGHHYLNVSEMHAARLVRMPWEESRDLLEAVFSYLYRADNLFEHRWRQGDLVAWDNRALQHARGSLVDVGRRVLQRVIVGTEGAAPHTL